MPLNLFSSLFKYASHVTNHSANEDTEHSPFACQNVRVHSQDIASLPFWNHHDPVMFPNLDKLDRLFLPDNANSQKFLCILNMSPD